MAAAHKHEPSTENLIIGEAILPRTTACPGESGLVCPAGDHRAESDELAWFG